jgi:hypothetical protein
MRKPICVAVLIVSVLAFSASSASASEPWWHLGAGFRPSSSEPESKGQVVIEASNLGDAEVNGDSSPVVLTDKLPAGLKAVSIEGFAGERSGQNSRGPVVCPSAKEVKQAKAGAALSCSFAGTLPSYHPIELVVNVDIEEGGVPAGEVNEASVSGGGARGASLRRELHAGGEPRFGVEEYGLNAEEADGSPSVQAGAHPFQLTSTLMLNQRLEPDVSVGKELPVPVQLAKDLRFRTPPGLVGDPTAVPRCPIGRFLTFVSEESGSVSACPSDTAIGVARVLLFAGEGQGLLNFVVPLFNLEPSKGEPARFGFMVLSTPVILDAQIRSGEDYGVTVDVSNIAQTVGFLESQVTFWGDPGNASHDPSRGYGCLAESLGESHRLPCHPAEAENPPAFLSLPTACTGSLQSEVEADSWVEPQRSLRYELPEPMPGLTGCNSLPFKPSISVTPDGAAGSTPASTPTGLSVDVHVPQEEALNEEGLAESDPRNITVALPGGVTVNPSSADGLQACTATPEAAVLTGGALGSPADQIGFQGGERVFPLQPGVKQLAFTPRMAGSFAAKEAGETSLLEPGIDFCAEASKIATVTIKTPLLTEPLEGAVYLATQNANPFGSLLAMYIVAEAKEEGVLVKLAGEVSLCKNAGEELPAREGVTKLPCQAPGQIITEFANSPQAPFEDAALHFFGGERAPLATPALCRRPGELVGPPGQQEEGYVTKATFTPWSAVPGEAPHESTSRFFVTSGPNGSPCPNPPGDQSPASRPFSPSLTGGATNLNAGAFSPFTLTMSRHDGEQNLQSVQAHLPPGLSGVLSNVELCPEPQANLGECGPNSLIGESTVSVGVGGEPFTVSGGKFYLTGPYNGSGGCTVGQSGCAPFGITFEVPAKAGPFDLERNSANPAGEDACDCVIVRGKIEIDPYTAALTITSNPPGTPYSIPTSLEGIPLEIQKVNAITTRGNFQFNPTNCSKMEVTGTIHSSEGGTDTIGVPFQVTNCRDLEFTPKFSVSTSGKTSKAGGASLTAKVAEPAGAEVGGGSGGIGSQANIAKVKVELPVQLPSRLTTLQKACTSAQFESNPAGCPSPSVIGHAKVITPLIPVPLEGPVYFVSHGGEAFPSLEIVLQGYGVKVILVGTTFISKAGITSTTFKTVPDAPFSTFELTLPEGPYSALAANGNLCAVKGGLKMPTDFVAQNGATLDQDTHIEVEGCPSGISIQSKRISKKTVKLSVYAPAAGKLTVFGKGVTSETKLYSGQEAQTFTLTQKKAGKLKTEIKLSFTPTKGNSQRARGKQTKTITVSFKK